MMTGMMTGIGEEPSGGTGTAVNPAEAVPGAVPPADRGAVPGRVPADRGAGPGRVRRPADLLLAVFAVAVVAVVLGAIRDRKSTRLNSSHS